MPIEILGRKEASPQGAVAPSSGRIQITGSRRAETPAEIKEREDISKARKEAYATAPEMNLASILTDGDEKKALALNALALLTPDPNEFGTILSKVDPNVGIQVSRDDEGRDKYVAINRKTNKIISLNNPGMSGLDFQQAAAFYLAANPAGKAATMAGRAGLEGLIQAGIEGMQTAAGGEFNPVEPLIAGGFSVAADAIPMALRATRGGSRGMVESKGIPSEASPAVAQVADMVRASARSTEEVPSSQMESLARMVDVDPQIIQAAEQLGPYQGTPMTEILTPGMASRNPQYVSVESGLAKAAGSELGAQTTRAQAAISDKADEFITRFGGDLDMPAVDIEITDEMLGTIEAMRGEARGLYQQIEGLVDMAQPVDPAPVIRFLREKAQKVGGMNRLSKVEQDLYKMATSDEQPFTYELLDQQRQLIGRQQRAASRGQLDPTQEGFKLGKLEDALLETQQAALEGINPQAAAIFDQARPLVAKRKELEAVATALLGKDLAGDIMPQIGAGLTQLSAGKLKKFRQVMEAIPEEYRARAIATAMNRVFVKGAQKNTQLTPGTFSAWFESLNRSKIARDELFKYMPEGAPEFLEALATVAKGIDRSVSAVPPTGVVNAMGIFDSDNGFIEKMVGAIPGVGSKLASLISRPTTDTVQAASSILADPVFKRLASRAARGEETTRLFSQLREKPVFKQWLQTLPEQTQARILSVGMGNYLFGDEG